MQKVVVCNFDSKLCYNLHFTGVHLNPNLILFIFLPPLLFESSSAMEIHQFKACFVKMKVKACLYM